MPSATENNGKSPPGMDETHLLVPWYAAGKLEEAEARQLEELAKEDQAFAELIAEAKREAQAAKSVNEALGGPPAAVWARIEESVEQERKAQAGARPAERFQTLRSAISNFLAELTAPQWQAIAAAAVAICVLEAGALAYLANGESKSSSKFHTASGPQAQLSARRSVFIVSFSDTATIGNIGKALDEAGAVIVEGPDSDMLYRIGLRNDNVGAKDQAYAKLQASGLVQLILPEK